MPTLETEKPLATREQILNAAQDSVLSNGFGATSIEGLIASVGISKSGFFYHFKDKNELAKALLVRYVETDTAILEGVFKRADELSEDPLHSYLIALRMLAEIFADLPNGHPGCVIASVCYHERLFSRDVLEFSKNAVLDWRDRFRERLERIAEVYPPRIDVNLYDLADMIGCVGDGGIILSRVTKNPMALPTQINLYRDFIRLVFAEQSDAGKGSAD
ncbi:TetR/AcrR family transcriptional regulator [Hyphococcus sp.]|uniref:TetR/AcrR family transcriptional regulator n=1 Tax=Hyphococcus sp. TaxID=2038636 RepID=UPI00208A3984|nr:MAG: hypothetical protein DHS20C04_26880 [Marinicaulis sp.]